MTKKKILFYPYLFLFLLSLATLSFSKEKGTLEKIVTSKGIKTLEVKVLLSFYSYYRQFELSNPNRVIVDFFSVEDIKALRHLKANNFGVLAIRAGMFKPDIARVVFDLIEEIPPYEIESIKGGLRVLFWLEEAPQIKEEQVIAERIHREDEIFGIKVEPVKANINDPILVDMRGSQHAKFMNVDVFNSEGIKIATKKLTPDSPQWQRKFDKPGEYFFKGKFFNIEGKLSENPCGAKIYINFAPICKLVFFPSEDYVGKPITFYASGSADPDGEVVKVDFAIADELGNLVEKLTDTEKPFTWEKLFEEEGVYTVTAVATDDFGAVSEPARVRVVIRRKK